MRKACSRLKFFSAVFFFPMRSLLGRIGLRYDLPSIANAYYRDAFSRVPVRDRAVILPHCLISEKCQARFSKDDGVLCVRCKKCNCGEVYSLCQERGWQFYITPSTGFTKRLVQRKGIRAAVGAACDFEIAKGVRSTPITFRGVRVKQSRVIPQVVVTDRYDCLKNDLDWGALKGIILDGIME